jgi:hypothetical protein
MNVNEIFMAIGERAFVVSGGRLLYLYRLCPSHWPPLILSRSPSPAKKLPKTETRKADAGIPLRENQSQGKQGGCC